MRKDVKFGLTIGAILVVTLVIYVIVLSRGSTAPQHITVAMPGPGDQPAATAENSDSGVTSHTDEAKTDTPADTDTNSTAGTNTSSTPTEPPVTNSNTPVPATQPAPVAQTNSDWEGALNNGPPAALAAPERTVTPMIGNSSNAVARAGISRTESTPMIDSLPSTQPSRPMMADIPTLDAAAPQTPPVAVAPRQDPTPAYTDAANMPLSTPSATPTNTPRTHSVVSGESMYTISQSVYGSGKYYKKILAANPKVDARHLRIGQILIIPELSNSDKPASSAALSAAPVDSKTAYTVTSGDTLESIARKLYGNPGMMDQLYEANKSLIGPDENVLKIGWTLKLPQAPTSVGDQR